MDSSSTPVVAATSNETNNTRTLAMSNAMTTSETAGVSQVNLNIISPPSASLTPEQEQEKQLKDKYPNQQRPGGSAFMQKILNRGNKKYFDSGDYNMAKSKSKASNLKNGPPASNLTTIAAATSSGEMSPTSTAPTIVVDAQPPTETTNEHLTVNNQAAGALVLTSPSINNQSNGNHHTNHHQTSPLSSNINIVNNPAISPMMLTNSLSSSGLLNSMNQQPGMPNSISTQSINMLSASLSTEKIANIHINSNNTNLLDTDEIGHGIPTPECLPQSRKHSIVQSKLATPRLSSS